MPKLRITIAALALAALASPTLAAAAAPLDDTGCAARLIWFINKGRDSAKDTSASEDQRSKAWMFVEQMRGALGYFEARIDATGSADRSKAFTAAVNEIANLSAKDHDKLVDQTMACMAQFEAAEARVLNSFKTDKTK